MAVTDEQREALLEDVYDSGFEYEREYGYCPQAVLAAIQDYFGVIDDESIQAAHALAGGGALCGDGTCGGLVGGMMAISNQFGRRRDQFGEFEDTTGQELVRSSKLAKELRERFLDEFGSVICNDVQAQKLGRSYDLWDPEDFEAFEAAGAHDDKCPDVTGKSARWTAEVLLDAGVEPATDE
jgi:C_GCAxxG_C_C family probable redox protein